MAKVRLVANVLFSGEDKFVLVERSPDRTSSTIGNLALAGEVIEVSEELADRLLNDGMAEKVGKPAEPEVPEETPETPRKVQKGRRGR